MPLSLTWEQIALRLALALIASLLIGLNRDESGRAAGMRTLILVGMASTIAMLQANLLMHSVGKTGDSFVVLDLMRNPLGILTGIGFIGAGAIIKKGDFVLGVTTAATIWFTTVLGLCFGGGQIALGIAGTTLALLVLWMLKPVEQRLPHRYTAKLQLLLDPDASSPEEMRRRVCAVSERIASWAVRYGSDGKLMMITAELDIVLHNDKPGTPPAVENLAALPGVRELFWKM